MNEYSAIDLFAGAGGFSLGFQLSDFHISLCLERDKWACETLGANHSSSKIIEEDVRTFNTPDKIREVVPVPPQVIIGGPPCQGFSTARGIKDISDPRNSLFKNFAYWVQVLRPDVFVMENVTGLLHRRNAMGQKVIDIIQDTFRNIGYNVEVWKLNAAEYGIPQVRQRIFIVGNRHNTIILPPQPTHYLPHEFKDGLLPAVTIWDAISDLPEIQAGGGQEMMEYTTDAISGYQTWARAGSNIVSNHVAMLHTKRLVERFSNIQSGLAIGSLPDHLKVRKRNGNGVLSETEFNSNYRVLNPNLPSPTIPASFYSNFIHPTLPRNITSREAARIQSFPDTYIFKGKRTMISSKLLKKIGREELDHLSQYNQIGNAVPPLLAKAIGSKIKNFLEQIYSQALRNQDLLTA